jgi:TolA-binding protein
MTTARFGGFSRPAIGLLLAACGGLMLTGEAQAQSPGQTGQRPFENTYRRPTVSPYLQLQQQGMNPLQNQNIYQTMVQPQMQQQQQQIEQLQQRRQLNKMQGQVRQIEQSSQARQFDETIRPTGHASTYMNYSHYYPQQRR